MSELMALDGKEYLAWIGELKKRYRATQIKAAVAVNSAMIEFYWNLGKDISEKYPGKVRDAEFFKRLSNDLRLTIPNATGLSITNIKYARYFFELYVDESYRPQLVDFEGSRPICETSSNDILQQLVAKLFQVPWGHHQTCRPRTASWLQGDGPACAQHAGRPRAHRLLICRDHNRILAQYMMDELKTPLGITDYELHRILPPVEKIQAALEEEGSKKVKI